MSLIRRWLVEVAIPPNNPRQFDLQTASSDAQQVADFEKIIMDQAAKAMRSGQQVRVTSVGVGLPIVQALTLIKP